MSLIKIKITIKTKFNSKIKFKSGGRGRPPYTFLV
jgi:hypothetical protein